MIIAGTSFLVGAIFQASAMRHVELLFIGRIFWGVGKISALLTYLLLGSEALHRLQAHLQFQTAVPASIPPPLPPPPREERCDLNCLVPFLG